MEISLELIIGLIVGIGIWAGILFAIIQSASKSKEQLQSLQLQSRLLIKIAEKNGVSAEEIKKCMKPMSLPDNNGDTTVSTPSH